MTGCAVCGTAGTKKNPVLALHEIGWAQEFADVIEVCQGCLRGREVASWTMRGAKGLKIHNALQNHGAPSRSKYTYLEEPSAIHLVRMRHDWILSHALAPQD